MEKIIKEILIKTMIKIYKIWIILTLMMMKMMKSSGNNNMMTIMKVL